MKTSYLHFDHFTGEEKKQSKILTNAIISFLLTEIRGFHFTVTICLKNKPRGTITPGSQTDSALGTLAVNNSGRNGATLMETQHVHAGWMQKTRRICYDIFF